MATKMTNISEAKWKKALTAIFEKLESPQYRKMVEFFEKNNLPAQRNITDKFKEALPEKLIQKFGMDESITLVNEAMKDIPRKDPGVQDLLRPFVVKLGKKEENYAEATKMTNISEAKWKKALTAIFEKLESPQYRKMVEFFEENDLPAQRNITDKFMEALPEKLIQMFGMDESITLVNEAMKDIPRKDPGVQDLLRPFVVKLGRNQENYAEASQMANISEDDWKEAMAKIFEKLEKPQRRKMVDFFEKNNLPMQQIITKKFMKDLPKKLIQMLGMDRSIYLVNEAMKEILGNNPGVQDLLRPIVDKLGRNQENQAEGLQTRKQPKQAPPSHERLLTVMKELSKEEVKTFKFYLKNLHESPDPLKISTSQVEKARITDLVELMLQVYPDSALENAKEILKKMMRNDLVQICACS